jgi:Uma2 family endonuclease
MATTTETPPTQTPTPAPEAGPSAGFDHTVCLPATWETYKDLLEARGERSRPKYTFVDGRLTAVSPGQNHEEIKTRLGGLIEDILVGLLIDFHASGGVTLLSARGSRAGTEGDESYYLTHIKEVRGKKDLVMGEDPPPDLAVEVVFSHPEDDALEAYRRIGVREVWVCKGGELRFLTQGPEGHYVQSPASALLPFLSSQELSAWLFRRDFPNDARLRHEFRAWVAETLAPRLRAAGD